MIYGVTLSGWRFIFLGLLSWAGVCQALDPDAVLAVLRSGTAAEKTIALNAALDAVTRPYELRAMDRKLRGEDRRPTNRALYLSAVERERYRIEVDAQGRLTQGGKPMHTIHPDRGIRYFLFVMDADGNLYAIEPRSGIFHSCLLAGADVAAAGTLVVDNGVLMKITNGSGHYDPPFIFLLQALERLRTLRADLTKMDLAYFGGDVVECSRAMAGY